MTTEERIEKLEAELAEIKAGLAAAKRHTRRLMVGVGVVLVMFALFVAVRVMTGEKGKVIRANRFELVDDKGITRAILRANEYDSKLILLDKNGTLRTWLSETELAMFDEKVTLRYRSWLRETGLSLYDENGQGRAELVATKAGSGLRLCDEEGRPRVELAVIEDYPMLRLVNENGKPRVILATGKEGALITLCDQNDKPRIMMGCTPSTPVLMLQGPDGKVIWSAPR